MTLFILKRLAQIIPVTLGVTLVVFLIMQMIPGDPAIILAGEGASQETVNELRENLGLNKPLAIQYTDYIKKSFTRRHGSFFKKIINLYLKKLRLVYQLQLSWPFIVF
ncbi:hypothetical protein OL548_30660 [Lysinibacillus sp. MHQ-1]|nr:hypothetical protein OL548_30660 [Lysinibacillus sp. MHQ-1]